MKALYSVLILAALLATNTCLFQKKHIYVNITLNWTDAQAYCRAKYVDLSTIDTEEELVKFRNNSGVASSSYNWIGLRGPFNASFILWSDGSSSTFNNFEKTQTDLSTSVCGLSGPNGFWRYDNCDSTWHFFCYTLESPVFVVQEMKTWDEALKHCRTFYTDLISLPKNQDLQMYKNKITNVQTPSFWIGLRFLDGSWFWLNQEPLENLVSLPSCPMPHLRCGAKQTGEDVFENRDCEEKMNFVCYH